MYSKNKMQKGFTLIELMVAITIFIIIMTISMGSIIGVFDANRKARSLKTVLNNLNLAVESMSKEIRYGRDYHCGSSGVIADPQNCGDGDNFISFVSSEGDQITYRLNGEVIEKRVEIDSVSGSADFIALTAPEITIDDLNFYVFGAENTDLLQPKIIIKIQGHSGLTEKGRSDFTLQTLVSQRVLDLDLAP